MVWPVVSHGLAHVARKGEDFHSFHDFIWRAKDDTPVEKDAGITIKVFAVYDGHGGTESADFVKSNIVNEFIKALTDLSCHSSASSRACWEQFHVKALQTAFVKVDEQCRGLFSRSGTTATLVIVLQEDVQPLKPKSGNARRAFVTIANVGDSSVYLDLGHPTVTRLNEEHRAGANKAESKRVEESGGSISRDDTKSPYRLYPGGLMMTRTIGDRDAHQAIAEPAICEIALRVEAGEGGGRLILASDGLWDAVSPKESANMVRKNKVPSHSAKALIRETTRREGRDGDDVTVFVIDISDAPDCPFQRNLPFENAPNRPVFIWRPLVENPPDMVKHLLANIDEKESADLPFFKEGEMVADTKDAGKREFKVVVCEGPMTLLANRGWMPTSQLSVPEKEQVHDTMTMNAIKTALLEDPIDRAESPPWTEPPASRRKKQQGERHDSVSSTSEGKQQDASDATAEAAKPKNKSKKSQNAKKRQGKQEKDSSSVEGVEAAEAEQKSGEQKSSEPGPTKAKKRASRAKRSSRSKAQDSAQQACESYVSEESIEHVDSPELVYDFFAVGFPDNWSEDSLVNYFEPYCALQTRLLKVSEDTKERVFFFNFQDSKQVELEERVCGCHIIDASRMYVARTQDAFDE